MSAVLAPAQEAPLIRMRQLRKVYRKRNEEFLAVSDVTMDVHAGDMISLVGPSGCGKSTLLKILSGLHGHDGGTLEIGGPGGAGFNPGRDVGMVFQQPLLLKWRTILENVLLPADILGLDRKAAKARAHELLDMVGLTGFADKLPYELSAACSSAPPLHARSSTTRSWCSWTSLSARSMRSRARR